MKETTMQFDNLDLSILKVLINNKKLSTDFCNDYSSDLFHPETRTFAKTVIDYVKTYKNLPTLRILSESLSKNSSKAGLEYINNVWNTLESLNYDEKEFRHDVDKLKKRYAERQIISVREGLSKLDPGSIDIDKVITNFQKTTQNIKSLSTVKAFERKTLKDAVPTFKQEYNAKLKDPNFDQGVKTGYSFLDNSTGGLREGELVLIGGESGGGKSMLLMNMAIQMWLQGNTIDMESNFQPGYDVLYFSLEMPFKPCLNRVLSRLSGAPSKLIRNAKLQGEDVGKLKQALKFLEVYPNQFEIIDIPRGATMETMEAMYEDACAYFNPKVVVIDYLGLMDYDGEKDMDDWLKLGKIAEKIHEFARVHKLIVLSAVQLNRVKGKDLEDKIGLHRIGRSALIMQNANIAIQINKRSSEEKFSDLEAFLIKNRDGALCQGSLIKNLACGTLLDNKVEEPDIAFNSYDISEQIEELENEEL